MSQFSKCKYCDKTIVWAEMPNGRWLPMDPHSGGRHSCSRSTQSAATFTSSQRAAISRLGRTNQKAIKREWNLRRDRSVLTFESSCWWCGLPVYFYRDDNGGCVLFDQLGHPWPIHSCWQSHCAIGNRLTNTHAVKHFSKSLDDLGYNGRFYNPTRQVRHRPIRSLVTETVSGYVVDNESLLDPPATIFLRASKQSSSAPFARLFVSASDGKSVPFLMPYPDVEQIEDFEIVTAAGIWVKRGVKWVLLLQKIKIENPIAGSERSVSFIHAVTPFICNICLKEIEAADYWGYDEKLKLECNTCSVARGKYSASDFIALCKSITDRHSPKSDSATAP